MSRHSLKCVLLLFAVLLWTAESVDLFGITGVYSAQVELELDQDDLEIKCLPTNFIVCTGEFVSFCSVVEHWSFTAEQSSVSYWRLRGPPLG